MENTKTKRLSTKSMVLCAMFTALVAVGAFIQIPVPYMDYFTLQFFFVLLAGLILGGNKGAISVGCYVLLGLIGIPPQVEELDTYSDRVLVIWSDLLRARL